MNINFKSKIKQLIPPILFDAAKRLTHQRYGWYGDYKTWEEAKRICTGYDNKVIFEKVKNAALKVKTGEVAYERDGVVFDKIEYSWQLLAGLMYVTGLKKGNLKVLDFGGALGTTYFQNREFFEGLKVKWGIVEQKHFVDFGNKNIEDGNIKFYESIQACLKEYSPDVVVLSSVIQYLEKPYDFLCELIQYKFEFIIFDRTTFTLNNKDRLTVQRVPPWIYPASYPCWFLSESKFLTIILREYHLIESFDILWKIYNIPSVFKGFIFSKK